MSSKHDYSIARIPKLLSFGDVTEIYNKKNNDNLTEGNVRDIALRALRKLRRNLTESEVSELTAYFNESL